jgi:ATP synthase protein I
LADDRQNDDLDQRIAKARATEQAQVGGSRVLAELIGVPTGAALIGWVLDRWLGTSPWILLVLLALGVIAAFRNIFRISKERAE